MKKSTKSIAIAGSILGGGMLSIEFNSNNIDTKPPTTSYRSMEDSIAQRQRANLFGIGGGTVGGQNPSSAPFHGDFTDEFDESVGTHSGTNLTATFEKAGDKNGIQYRKGKITVNGNTYEFMSGGNGNGYLPKGEYKISTPQNNRNSTAGMVVDGYGYSFHVTNPTKQEVWGNEAGVIDNRNGKLRTALRIHPDGGNPGTMGCIGIQGGKQTQTQFYNDMAQEIKNNGGAVNINVG